MDNLLVTFCTFCGVWAERGMGEQTFAPPAKWLRSAMGLDAVLDQPILLQIMVELAAREVTEGAAQAL